MRRKRIDRRITAGATSAATPQSATEVIFCDESGTRRQRFDLGELGLPSDVTTLLIEAFRHHHAGSTHGSRRSCWGALRVFARFAHEDSLGSTEDLTTAMLGRYLEWLDRQSGADGRPWSKICRANRLNHLRQLVMWTKRHHPERLPRRIDFPFNPYPRRAAEVTPRPRLPAPALKSLLRACYEEIDAAWAHFEEGRTILAAGEDADKAPALHAAIRDLARAGGGILPSAAVLMQSGAKKYRIDRNGGLRTLGAYLHLTPDTLAPLFLAIAAQTAANPSALRLIRRDCLVPHPLDEHVVIIDWSKAKTAAKLKRAQRRSFDVRRPNAAPNLIAKVLAMTAPLVTHAPERNRERLFLVKSEKGRGVVPISEELLYGVVKRFIQRTNARITMWNRSAPPDRRREPLPDFAAAFLRGSVATEHYRASGGDILVAQRVLNHASANTTEAYIKGPETRRLREETVAQLQALMIAWITGGTHSAQIAGAEEAIALGERAHGFARDCLNPIAGASPGSTPGRLCPHFGGCLACPGLVISIDAPHLARVLQAKERLEAARGRIDPHRFALLYAPSYRILVHDILPDFPGSLHASARQILPTLAPLPDLE